MRRKNKKKSILLVLLMLIAGISMGYAILNTTLNINGTSKIKDAKWNVYWDNPQVTTGSVTTTAPTIDSIKTTATFGVTLNNPKDYYEFTIDAVNAGTIDAMIKVNGVNNKVYSDAERTQETNLPAAISYTVTYADGTTIQDKHLLAKKSGNTPTRETYKVRVEYREDISAQDLEEIAGNPTYYMSFNVEYVQADNTATESHPSAITYINRQVAGQITPGDIIGIGETEDFYVISSDSEKTVLLAKYNLMVGNIVENDSFVGTMTSENTQGYGLQSIDSNATYNCDDCRGGVDFSSTNYWDGGDYDNPNLLSPYNANGASYEGDPYPYVYNSSLTIPPDLENENGLWATPGYSIAYYVEQYKTKLIKMGAPSTITGRLLSYEEVDSAQSIEDNGIRIIFDAGSDFWLGSAQNSRDVWIVSSYYSDFIPWSYICGDYSDYYYGVRPVIEIPTSELQ